MSGGPAEPGKLVEVGLKVGLGGSSETLGDLWGLLLRQRAFADEHPFAELDYLPADRTFPRGQQPSLNPALLGREQTEAFRQQVAGSFMQQRQLVRLSGIAPVLASLDYLDLLA